MTRSADHVYCSETVTVALEPFYVLQGSAGHSWGSLEDSIDMLYSIMKELVCVLFFFEKNIFKHLGHLCQDNTAPDCGSNKTDRKHINPLPL